MTDGAGDRLHVARVTLEALSPLSIGSGDSRTTARKEKQSDGTETEVRITVAAIQRDANGLPTIPGPGLQGALRALAAEVYGEAFANRMFGHEESGNGDGQAGRVNWGWACAHDSSGEAVSGLRLPELATESDGVLRLLAADAPVWRDHVALSGRHSVDGRRKFARAAAPAGARFSAELSGWGDDDFRESLARIVGLFRHPRLRIGGGSGRGYGRIALRAATCAEAPLDDPGALRRLRAQPPSAPLETDLLPLLRAPGGAGTTMTLLLKCEGLLRIGASEPHAKHLTRRAASARGAATGAAVPSTVDGAEPGKDAEGEGATLRLMREPYILWNGDGARRAVRIDGESDTVPPEQLRFPVPGSSIRGPLAHRTLFHANALAGRCIDADALRGAGDAEKKKARVEHETRDRALRDFFGAAKEAGDLARETGEGRAGRVSFDDAEVRGAQYIVGIDHVSIDRFAGGAREITGALFREEALLGGRIEATVIVRPPLGAAEDGPGGWPARTARAFLLAVRDLCIGRLALGGRSNGTCRGAVRFSGADAEAWRRAAREAKAPLEEGGE